MNTLYFPDNEKPDENLVVCTGGDIDFSMSQEDAIIEFTAANTEGEYIPMCPYGYTLNLVEAKQLQQLLNEAIEKAEAAL